MSERVVEVADSACHIEPAWSDQVRAREATETLGVVADDQAGQLIKRPPK
jgi:hypothetical protein